MMTVGMMTAGELISTRMCKKLDITCIMYRFSLANLKVPNYF